VVLFSFVVCIKIDALIFVHGEHLFKYLTSFIYLFIEIRISVVFLIIFQVSVNIIVDVLQVSVNVFRKRKKISVLFLDISDEWNGIETLQDIIRFVTDLCVSGLIVEQGDYLLLHETLRFFEMVSQ
jgi:hypothetical protein